MRIDYHWFPVNMAFNIIDWCWELSAEFIIKSIKVNTMFNSCQVTNATNTKLTYKFSGACLLHFAFLLFSIFDLQLKQVIQSDSTISTLIHQSVDIVFVALKNYLLFFRILRAKHVLNRWPEWRWIRIEQIGWFAFNWTISVCARVAWFTFIYLGLYRLIIIIAPVMWFFNHFRQHILFGTFHRAK